MNLRYFKKSHNRHRERGIAVTVVLILLCIMAIFLAANTFTVNWLRKQVDAVDKKETARLHQSQTISTNSVSR